jgi:hypothetical protein
MWQIYLCTHCKSGHFRLLIMKSYRNVGMSWLRYTGFAIARSTRTVNETHEWRQNSIAHAVCGHGHLVGEPSADVIFSSGTAWICLFAHINPLKGKLNNRWILAHWVIHVDPAEWTDCLFRILFQVEQCITGVRQRERQLVVIFLESVHTSKRIQREYNKKDNTRSVG